MSIKDWPEQQRPRERLLADGPRALSDAELLAVFLRVGVTGKSAVELGRDLLCEFGSLNGLFNASLDGKVRRAIDIREGERIDESAFKALVREAVALNRTAKSKVSTKAKS